MAGATPPNHAAASKMAQLLAETMVQAAPHTAKIHHEEKHRQITEWLEGLESHTSGQVSGFLEHVLANSDMPTFLRPLFEEAIDPPAEFSAFLEQIFLYGIISNIIGTAVGPFIQGVSNQLNATAVASGIARPTDPSVIATAVGRGLNLGSKPTVDVPDWAHEEAAKSGVSKADINLMASIVGLPPALQELFELYRRGIIDIDKVKLGLREGDFRTDWIDEAVQLAHTWLNPLDFVRAAVQAQMSYDDAKHWAQRTGLDVSTDLPVHTQGTEATPDMFGLAFAIAGRPPGPEQLAHMALRGIIDWEGEGANALSFQQGIAESDVKTKWTPALRKLSEYIPPPRAVGTLLGHGVIDHDTAVGYWEASGVPPALAKAYAKQAEHESTIQEKHLAKGDVLTGYYDGLFSKATAEELLSDLGYVGETADRLLALVDFRREIKAIDQVVRKIGTLYQNHKIDAVHAIDAITHVGLDEEQASALLAVWEPLRVAPVRLPTVAEIGMAVSYGTSTVDDALDELGRLGYEPRDAAIVLSAHSKVKIEPLPPRGDTVTG